MDGGSGSPVTSLRVLVSVDSDVQAAIISPLEQGVKKGEPSILLHLHSEPDGQSHIVQVGQELLHCALLRDAAGVVYIPLPKVGLCGGSEADIKRAEDVVRTYYTRMSVIVTT